MYRLLLLFFLSLSTTAFAGRVHGVITDVNGKPLPYASISVKGTTKGTTANGSGQYSIVLDAGKYSLVCQYVGYGKIERVITVGATDLKQDFMLQVQELT